MIDKNGQTVRYNDLDLNVGSTRDDNINARAVQIALVGNFANEQPTEAQYKELKRVIDKVMKVNHKKKIQIVGHEAVSPTSCPGRNFDFGKVRELPAIVEDTNGLPLKAKQGTKVLTFRLSRYYSPMPNQTKYYANRDYLSDVKMNCGLNADGTAGDCLHTANGYLLTKKDIGKSVACDVQYKGKKLYLDGVGVVTCNDVGWAIKGNRVDVWCGIGEDALKPSNRNNCPTWIKNGYFLDS